MNDTFTKNAWHFRNALVRANYTNLPKGIFEDKIFFNSFLRNLLLGENNLLENRNLHVSASKVETSRELKNLNYYYRKPFYYN